MTGEKRVAIIVTCSVLDKRSVRRFVPPGLLMVGSFRLVDSAVQLSWSIV